MTNITIIDYGSANIRSVQNAFEYLGANVSIIDNGLSLDQAERIVLPGVGSFDSGMKGLHEREFIQPLREAVMDRRAPYMGICLGMQFLLEGSDEGHEAGLGWIKGKCKLFPQKSIDLPVPHIAWNDTIISEDSAMFHGVELSSDFYFVHSYFVPESVELDSICSATCDYGTRFVAALEYNNIWACQFHPEKSQLAGMKLLENFLATEIVS